MFVTNHEECLSRQSCCTVLTDILHDHSKPPEPVVSKSERGCGFTNAVESSRVESSRVQVVGQGLTNYDAARPLASFDSTPHAVVGSCEKNGPFFVASEQDRPISVRLFVSVSQSSA